MSNTDEIVIFASILGQALPAVLVLNIFHAQKYASRRDRSYPTSPFVCLGLSFLGVICHIALFMCVSCMLKSF